MNSGPTEMASQSLTLRPNPLRQRASLLGVLLIAAIVAVAIVNPRQVVAAIIAIVVIVGAFLLALAKVRITVTPDQIVIADIFGPGRAGRAPRSSVASIHIRSYWIVLEDPAGQEVVSSRPYWTMRQLLGLSQMLGVPLINHRRLRGWRRDTRGTVEAGSGEPDRAG